MAIVFLQSALDKIIHYKGNTDWLKSHFASTALKGIVPGLLFILTVFETLSGILTALGAVCCFTSWGRFIGCIGLSLSLSTFLMLLFGQRMAKDYQGAGTLTGYFIIAAAGLFSVLLSGF
ncbi:MAG: DoxX family protein [Bacteroidetes bacterium]|nr:DoxX family protein [Bacteroidota bacterium]